MRFNTVVYGLVGALAFSIALATNANITAHVQRIDNTYGAVAVVGSQEAGYWGQQHTRELGGNFYLGVTPIDHSRFNHRCDVSQRQELLATLNVASRQTDPGGKMVGVRLLGATTSGDVIFAVGPNVYRFSCSRTKTKPIHLAEGNQFFQLTYVAEMPDGSIWLNFDAHWHLLNEKAVQQMANMDVLVRRIFVLRNSKHYTYDLPDARDPHNKSYNPYGLDWFPSVSERYGLCTFLFRRHAVTSDREVFCIGSNLRHQYLGRGRVLNGFSKYPSGGPFFISDENFFSLEWTPWGDGVAAVIEVFGKDAWLPPSSSERSKRRRVYLRGILGEMEGPSSTSRWGYRTILQRGPYLVYVTKKGLYRLLPDGPVVLYRFRIPEEDGISLLPGPGLSLFITSKKSIYHVDLVESK